MAYKQRMTEQEQEEFAQGWRAGVVLVSLELMGLAALMLVWPYPIEPMRVVAAVLIVCITAIMPASFVLQVQDRRRKYRAQKAQTQLDDTKTSQGG